MKYGKIHAASLSESAMDLMLNYGLAVPQAIAERSPAPIIGLYGYNKGEEAVGSGRVASKVGRKLGNALRRSKGLPPIQNQQQESSSVRRAGLREVADFEVDPAGVATPATSNPNSSKYKHTQAEHDQERSERVKYGQDDPAPKPASKVYKAGVRNTLGAMEQRSARGAWNSSGNGLFDRLFVHPHNRRDQLLKMGQEQRARSKRKLASGDELGEDERAYHNQVIGAKGDAGAGKVAQARLDEVKRRLENQRAISANRAKAALTPVEKPVWGSRAGSYGKGMLALGGVAAYQGLKAVTNAAQEVSRTASGGYADMIRGSSRMGESSTGLRENQATWQTRKTKYGPSGRKPWKFDFTKKSHVSKILKLGTDSDAKKMMKSNANITKHIGMQTKAGVPLKFAYASNDRKHLYAGKTIGMRQNILSQHKKLGIPLPKGFENSSFDQINELFKKRLGHGWYKRQYNKAPIHRKLMIGAASLWKGVKKSLGLGESAISELATFTESAAPTIPTTCTFMEGSVATPMECDCAECLSVTRRAREGKALTETSETSFGQNLRDGVQGSTELTGSAEPVKKISLKQVKRFAKRRKQIGV